MAANDRFPMASSDLNAGQSNSVQGQTVPSTLIDHGPASANAALSPSWTRLLPAGIISLVLHGCLFATFLSFNVSTQAEQIVTEQTVIETAIEDNKPQQ